MTVYVDGMAAKFGRMIMCHMLADTVEELHEMADRIGVNRKWFQNHGTPHYDISLSKKAAALLNGAVMADNKKVVELIRKHRGEAA